MTLAKQEANTKTETTKTGTKRKQTKTLRRQVSVDGETCGEKKVKRPKLSCVEIDQEAKVYHVSSSVKDEVDIP